MDHEFMTKIEELFPDLENYLRNVLAKERLSSFAEIRRREYVKQLDVIKFNPPSLPPRPIEGLMQFSPTTVPQSSPSGADRTQTTNHLHAKSDRKKSTISALVQQYMPSEPAPSEDIYEAVDENDHYQNRANIEEDYLEPEKTIKLATEGHSWSDSDSGGSGYHEPYDDDIQNTSANTFDESHEDVPLPSRMPKSKKGKGPTKTMPELPVKNLQNIAFKGDLSNKESWGWKKRFCVISENSLYLYKSEKDLRPTVHIQLSGYDVTYIDKEGRRNFVIKLSRQGCETTTYLAADLKEIAELWIGFMKSAAGTEVPSSGDSEILTMITADSAKSATSSTLSDVHSTSSVTPESSGDGTVSENIPQATIRQTTDDKKQVNLKKKKKLSSFFGSIGLKQGQKLKRHIDLSDICVDPRALMSGVLDVCHNNLTKGDWSTRYCFIKHRNLHVHCDNVADGVELSLPLAGADINSARKETKKELSLRIVFPNKETMLIDTTDTIEQGKWLHALIKEKEGIKDESDEAIYENEDSPVASPPHHEAIYDEVVHDVNKRPVITLLRSDSDRLPNHPSAVTIKRASSSASDSESVSRQRPPLPKNNPPVGGLKRASSSASDSDSTSVNRPPLPATNPPKRPLPLKKRQSYIEDEEYECYDEKSGSSSSAAAKASRSNSLRSDEKQSPNTTKETIIIKKTDTKSPTTNTAITNSARKLSNDSSTKKPVSRTLTTTKVSGTQETTRQVKSTASTGLAKDRTTTATGRGSTVNSKVTSASTTGRGSTLNKQTTVGRDRTGSGRGTSTGTNNRTGSTVGRGTTTNNGAKTGTTAGRGTGVSKQGAPAVRRGVKERLKMWEAMGEDTSNQ